MDSRDCVLLIKIMTVVSNMSSDDVPVTVAQRIIIKFLCAEGEKAVNIYRRLQTQFGEECLSRSSVFEWCNSFVGGRKRVSNLPHAARPATAVNDLTIRRVDELIRENRRIKIRELADLVKISVRSVQVIIHDKLNFNKVSARWVPKDLSDEQRQKRVQISQELLQRFQQEGDDFLERIITVDESWMHHYIPESKQASMEWRHSNSPPPKKFKTTPSAGKVMATVFWDIKGPILVDFLTDRKTVNAEYYSQLLSKVRDAVRSKRRGLLSKGIILLHDNARPHVARLTQGTIEQLRWEVLPHPPYSPDLSPCDYHLFGPLKEALGGKKFKSNEEVMEAVRIWLRMQPKNFFSSGIRKLPERWNKCIIKQGHYIEK